MSCSYARKKRRRALLLPAKSRHVSKQRNWGPHSNTKQSNGEFSKIQHIKKICDFVYRTSIYGLYTHPRLINKQTLIRMQAIGRSGTNGQMNPEIEDASRIKIFQLRINLSSKEIMAIQWNRRVRPISRDKIAIILLGIFWLVRLTMIN